MYSGLSERSIHRRDVAINPGDGTGSARVGTIQPALTCEAARSVGPASSTVTGTPRRWRAKAVESPMIPPPTTILGCTTPYSPRSSEYQVG